MSVSEVFLRGFYSQRRAVCSLQMGKWLSCTTRYRTAEYFVTLNAKQLLSGDQHVKNQNANLQTIFSSARITSCQLSDEIACDRFDPKNEGTGDLIDLLLWKRLKTFLQHEV